jgi:hypothetical protein
MVNAHLVMLSLMECVLEKTSYHSSSFQMNLLAATDTNLFHHRRRRRLRHRLRLVLALVLALVLVLLQMIRRHF